MTAKQGIQQETFSASAYPGDDFHIPVMFAFYQALKVVLAFYNHS